MSTLIDLTGQRFGRLLVLSKDTAPRYRTDARWDCMCDCGKAAVVISKHLRMGITQSCGCLRLERVLLAKTTHGHSNSRTWKSWQAMRTRCENPKRLSWAAYGGRGIIVHDDWKTFDGFLRDMGVRPPGTSLDRKDVNGNYERANCRWATPKQQRANRRDAL